MQMVIGKLLFSPSLTVWRELFAEEIPRPGRRIERAGAQCTAKVPP
jgi:hypothetical protein